MLQDANLFHSILDIQQQSLLVAEEAVSAYSKVDKTGFIGFIAEYIEIAIDFAHNLLKQAGLEFTYGYSIILFTIFGGYWSVTDYY